MAIRKKTLKMMKERMACPEVEHGDFLDILINEVKNEKTLITHEIALDLIFGLLFAAFYPHLFYTDIDCQVITEATRLSNFVAMLFRKASHDYTTKEGYTIPAGWAVMVCPPVSHFNPEVYKDPLTFNPWRWEKGSDTTGGSKDYLAFGSGLRHCAGSDFSKTQMTIFLHHLITNYRWTRVRGGEVDWRPEICFPKGYRIRLEKSN
ncbi:hypothetical protein ACLOJK_005091 [Asimina triloba]